MTRREIPLVCNLTAMAPAQRERYEAQKTRLMQAGVETRELLDGYLFRFRDEPDLLLSLAEFVEGERQCCPFYTFQIAVLPNGGGMSLQITGPDDTKAFIREALAHLRGQ